MNERIPNIGGANKQLAQRAHDWWTETAGTNKMNLNGFDSEATFETRIGWANTNGFDIGTVYSRFSTKLQNSTDDQVRENIQWAAKNRIYVPPELISIDEAVKGKCVRRAGLERTKAILRERLASVLLVFKASRLFRQAGKGFLFINEEVVEQGLRAVSVSQGIDTSDRKIWKLQLQIHGLMDDMLLDAIADHVRSGLKGLFLNNWTTGALGIGFRPKELPNAPLTKRERPRTTPEVDPEAAKLIQEHARLLLEGMSIREGVRRWNAVKGPRDPRSTSEKMLYGSYRRLFSNPRLIGKWEFGRKKNQFSTKLDGVKQIEQSDEEVATIERDELRILDDNTFESLQSLFSEMKTGPRGPTQTKRPHLWDLTTEFFYCANCSTAESHIRFYQTGANGGGMQCKNGDLCKSKTTVSRKEAVQAICKNLTSQIAYDHELIELIVHKSLEFDASPDHEIQDQLDRLKKRLKAISNRVNDLFDLSGEGSEEDRNETKARLRLAQSERAAIQIELTSLERSIQGTTKSINSNDVRGMLSNETTLLLDAASGNLGDDAIYKALSIFRTLTGEQIMVHVERRANRKRTNVRGSFRSGLSPTKSERFSDSRQASSVYADKEEIILWLREPPRLDAIAERVHRLIDEDVMSHREVAKQLRSEGHKVNSGNVWYSYYRWYEMQNLDPPKVPYNNGKKRCSV